MVLFSLAVTRLNEWMVISPFSFSQFLSAQNFVSELIFTLFPLFQLSNIFKKQNSLYISSKTSFKSPHSTVKKSERFKISSPTLVSIIPVTMQLHNYLLYKLTPALTVLFL